MKRNVVITMNPEIWDLAQRKFPRQVSGLLETYLIGLLNVELPEIEGKSSDKIQEEADELQEQINRTKLKRDSLLANKTKISKEEEIEEDKILADRIELFKAMKNARIMK